MQGLSCVRWAASVVAALATLACATGASAQVPASAPGLGDQLFATGGEITVEVVRSFAGYTSDLRLFNAEDTFVDVAVNREAGRIVTLPARPTGEELVFGIFVRNTNFTYKMGPGARNPDGIEHAIVTQTGEREFKVAFEDLPGGGDRNFEDNVFIFRGGLAPNRPPVADDQALTIPQGGSLPITLTGTDADGDPLTFSLTDQPPHGALSGSGATLTYTPAADFSGTDTFGFKADDGKSTAEGRVTIEVTPTGAPPPPTVAGSSTVIDFGPCPAGELTLLNVRSIGRRALLTGLAKRTLAGAPVSIVEAGAVIARTTIRPDGTFRVRVDVPRIRGGRILRYQAQLGRLHSRNVRLKRRVTTTSAKLENGRIVIRGRVANPPRRGRRALVRLMARPRGCGTRRTQIGRTRLRRDGSFTVRGQPLAGADPAVYQARVQLPRKHLTFSLPQTIARR